MPDDIEQLLSRQPVRQPSAALHQRIEQALNDAAAAADNPAPLAGPEVWYRRLPWRQLTVAAAAVALSVLVLSVITRYLAQQILPQPSGPIARQTPVVPAPTPQEPKQANDSTAVAAAPTPTVTFQRVDSELIDQGVVVAGDTGPMRKYRQETIEKVWYYDPQTKEMKEVTTPHEAYVYLPLEVY